MRSLRDERGATAVLVGIMAVSLLGMSGFVADFGLAYANKRATQTAADAAALGAAGVFATQPYRSCGEMLANGISDARVEALSKVDANDTSSAAGVLAGGLSATCTGGDLVVRASVTSTSPNFFGKILGYSSDYNLERSASAAVEAATTGPRMRPLALCASDLPAAAVPGTPFRLYAPGNGLAPPGSCPIPPNAGNWWTLDCPGEHSDDADEARGTAALEDQIRNGCSSPVEIVPDQGSLMGSALNLHLASRCASIPSVAPFICLEGDPGQPDAGGIENAWKDLIDQELTVPIPVFCTPSPGRCATSSVTGTGTNAIFPVHKLISVQICGYHFGKQPSKQYRAPSTMASCNSAATMLAEILTDNSDDVYLVMVARNLSISGVTADSQCALGDERCDGGLRQVRLTE